MEELEAGDRNGSGLSPRVVREFFELCNHTYEVWVTLRTLYDDNPRVEEFFEGGSAPFFSRLNVVLREYVMQQTAKLHDPAVQQGRVNLTLEYVLRFGAWDEATSRRLKELLEQFQVLAKRIKPARNRILSHNDLETILSGKGLGGFPEDADRTYFEVLQEFVSLVHEKTVGGPLPFTVAAHGDAHMFLKDFRGREAESERVHLTKSNKTKETERD